MNKEDFRKLINEEIESLNDSINYSIKKEENTVKEFDYITCLISRRIGLEHLLYIIDNTKEEE